MTDKIASADPIVMKSRWAAQLIAHPHDLENLVSKLNSCIISREDFYVSEIGRSACLRTSRWDHISDVNVLRGIISREIRTIRGCLDSLDGCAYLSFGTIFELDMYDNILKKTRGVDVKISIIPDIDERATARSLRDLIALAENNIHFNSAVAEFEAFADWYSIYKAIESCLGIWKGINNYKKHDAKSGNKIALAKQTANWHRHASVDHPYPVNAMDISEARDEVKKLITITASHLNRFKSDVAQQPLKVVLPQNKYVGQDVNLPKMAYGDGRGFEVGIVGKQVNWVPTEMPDL